MKMKKMLKNMFPIFKSIDEKFAEIGFIKIEEDEYGAVYKRRIDKYNYTQTLDLVHKASGRHIIQSYDEELTDQKKIGNTCVGLTMYEAKLCVKKMKQMGWKITKEPIENENGDIVLTADQTKELIMKNKKYKEKE